MAAAISWLVAEQCPDGGWTSPDNAINACNGLPAAFAGPDTNSTALAVQGLAAQGALTLVGLRERARLPYDRSGCRRRLVLLPEHDRHARLD